MKAGQRHGSNFTYARGMRILSYDGGSYLKKLGIYFQVIYAGIDAVGARGPSTRSLKRAVLVDHLY